MPVEATKNIIMKKKLIISIALALFIVQACKKENSAKQQTRTEIISSQPWKFDKAIVSGLDISSQIPACYKDNLYTLRADKTGSIDESTNVCSPSTAGNLTWRFSTNEDSLILSVPLVAGFSGAFKIDSLGTTIMKLSQTVNVPPTNLPAPAVLQLKR
jgi:hypothetical protein